MKSFLVRAPLKTPVLLSEGYMTLDALLAYAYEMATGKPAGEDDVPIALESGIRKASAAMFTMAGHEIGVSVKTMFRRLQAGELAEIPEQAMPRRGGRYIIEQASGDFCAAVSRFTVFHADAVHWFCVGDPDAVLTLLNVLPGVGRKASLGWGAFLHEGITIDECPDCSWSFMGKPARPLPAGLWGGRPAQLSLAAVRYPYWGTMKTLAVVPVTRIFRSQELHVHAVRP